MFSEEAQSYKIVQTNNGPFSICFSLFFYHFLLLHSYEKFGFFCFPEIYQYYHCLKHYGVLCEH